VISAVASSSDVDPLFDQGADDDGEWEGTDHDHPDLEVHIEVPVLGHAGSSADGHPPEPVANMRQRRAALRKRNSEAVAELSRFVDMDHRRINAELNRLSGVTKVSEATVDQLQRRLDAANAWLRGPRSKAR
jgi:hypothetical protein